ncbi:PEP-CTERM sorting domain-containing protein [Luteolibacter sp. Populi]|uniref:PEP-CTERM sorting domain-containing protein n=1 Tax=Luteolibacter sp. Populi TaxID=3230487 RepID=UPI0034673F27
MKAPRRSRRPLFLLPVIAALLGGSSASAAYVINDGTGLFAPSFRGTGNTTHFGWESGTWDGNPPPAVGEPDPSPDIINGIPSINPGGLPATSYLTQGSSVDIVSGSNNIYSDVGTISAAGLQLVIPTSGTIGLNGFTTIIIQGSGLSGTMFGFDGALDGFGFGTINGVEAEYVIARNAAGSGQWWAKWSLAGNAASYTVDVFGQEGSPGGSVLSVTNMQIDTLFSQTGFALDSAVPEPSSLLLSLLGVGMLIRRRR